VRLLCFGIIAALAPPSARERGRGREREREREKESERAREREREGEREREVGERKIVCEGVCFFSYAGIVMEDKGTTTF
jgi:hypothetical protein